MERIADLSESRSTSRKASAIRGELLWVTDLDAI